jgi:hypothetical protein
MAVARFQALVTQPPSEIETITDRTGRLEHSPACRVGAHDCDNDDCVAAAHVQLQTYSDNSRAAADVKAQKRSEDVARRLTNLSKKRQGGPRTPPPPPPLRQGQLIGHRTSARAAAVGSDGASVPFAAPHPA